MANEKRLIDANDFLDLFYVASAGQDKTFVKVVEMVLEDAPTVDAVEVVHGRKEKSVISKTGLMCTACYSDIDRDAVFCKYCGAKMDGDGNGN